jgi:hypothetical protein
MSFSATEAAFEGFRVTRHHPLAVVAWTLTALVTVVVMGIVISPILNPALAELQRIAAAGPVAGGVKMSEDLMTRAEHARLAVVPVIVLMQAILLPAIYRAMNRSGSDRFGFLRLGRDELRVLGAQAIVSIVLLVVTKGGEVLATLAVGTGMAPVAMLIEAVSLIVCLYLSVRLVLVVPAVLAEGRIDLKAGWDATAGRFWPLLGMAVIAAFMAFVVALLLIIIALPISMSAQGVAGGGLVITNGALMIIMALAMALMTTIMAAPFMAAYRGIKGQAPA